VSREVIGTFRGRQLSQLSRLKAETKGKGAGGIMMRSEQIRMRLVLLDAKLEDNSNGIK